MATTEFDERNVIEADAVNWRLIVYPIVAAVAVLLVGFGSYYYILNQREQAEGQAAAALATAKTPADMVKVADQFPKTVQAGVALMRAADLSFNQGDFTAALADYQRVAGLKQAPSDLRDSALLGVAAAQEASGQEDAGMQSYLSVAHKGNRSPFAPVAFHQAARIFATRKDTANETQILQQAVQLGGDSPFVKEAADRLKTLVPPPAPASAPAPVISSAPAPSPSPATNAGPAK